MVKRPAHGSRTLRSLLVSPIDCRRATPCRYSAGLVATTTAPAITKTCTGCGKSLPITDYPLKGGGHRRSTCRTCTNKLHKERYQDRRPARKCRDCGEPVENRASQICSACRAKRATRNWTKCHGCGRTLPRSEFGSDSQAIDGRKSRCLPCARKRDNDLYVPKAKPKTATPKSVKPRTPKPKPKPEKTEPTRPIPVILPAMTRPIERACTRCDGPVDDPRFPRCSSCRDAAAVTMTPMESDPTPTTRKCIDCSRLADPSSPRCAACRARRQARERLRGLGVGPRIDPCDAPDPRPLILLRCALAIRRQTGESFEEAWPVCLRTTLHVACPDLSEPDRATWSAVLQGTMEAWRGHMNVVRSPRGRATYGTMMSSPDTGRIVNLWLELAATDPDGRRQQHATCPAGNSCQ
jgi:hypothetical protein